MKRCLFLLWLSIAAITAAAQQPQCLPVSQLWRYGLSLEKLNQRYPSILEKLESVNNDSVKVLQFNLAADAWFTQLATYLKDNGVKFSEKEPIFLRIYVNKNNQAQYLIYQKATKRSKGVRMQAQLHQQAESFMRLHPVNFGFSGPWRHAFKLKVE